MREAFEHTVNAIVQLAEAYYRSGQLPLALDIIIDGIKFCDRDEMPSDVMVHLLLAQIKFQTTSIFMSASPPKDALDTIERCRKLSNETEIMARLDDLTGLVHYYDDLRKNNTDYAIAKMYLNRVLTYPEEMRPLWQSEWLFHRGLVYQNTDEMAMARDVFQRSYEIAKKHDLKEMQSFAIRHIGFIQQHVDQDLDVARASFEESLRLREEIGLTIYLPFSYQTLGAVCMAQGKLDDAQPYFEKARETALAIHNQRALVLSLFSLGDLQSALEDSDEAKKFYIEAKDIAESIQFERAIALIDQKLEELDTQ